VRGSNPAKLTPQTQIIFKHSPPGLLAKDDFFTRAPEYRLVTECISEHFRETFKVFQVGLVCCHLLIYVDSGKIPHLHCGTAASDALKRDNISDSKMLCHS
jgi:hypothetical protein